MSVSCKTHECRSISDVRMRTVDVEILKIQLGLMSKAQFLLAKN